MQLPSLLIVSQTSSCNFTLGRVTQHSMQHLRNRTFLFPRRFCMIYTPNETFKCTTVLFKKHKNETLNHYTKVHNEHALVDLKRNKLVAYGF